MAKLVSHVDGIVTYEVLRLWTYKEHEVALMRLTNKDAPENASSYLMCECDFDLILKEDEHGSYRTHRNDPHACESKKVVRNVASMDARRSYGAAWKKMGLKETILDIKRRVDAGEWLGQHYPSMIYTQEVAELLDGKPSAACGLSSDPVHDQVLAACRELYAEEKLELNGRILTEYIQRFRFPEEMVGILRWIVEEPLGWPNGEAGEGYVGELEREIQERHGFKSGKEAFGKHWPNIDGLVLAEFALEPTAVLLLTVAPLFPRLPVGEEVIGHLVEEALESQDLVAALQAMAAAQPDIAVPAFKEFISSLLRLAFERVEIDRAMRTEKVPPAQTLREMAEYLEQVAENFRDQAKKA